MNKSNSNAKGKSRLKGKGAEEEENDVDQNVRPGQQPGKPAPPSVNKPGRKLEEPEKDKDTEDAPEDTTPPDEFKSREKARKEARKISEAEGFHREHKK